jgi:hypothetical protein
MSIKVYPYFTEDLYYGRNHKYLVGVHTSKNIQNRLKTEFGISEFYGVFISKDDYTNLTKMKRKEDTKIFEVDVCLPDGNTIPCTCFLTKKVEYSEYLENDIPIYFGKIIENTDKEELDRAYHYNAMLDNREEW